MWWEPAAILLQIDGQVGGRWMDEWIAMDAHLTHTNYGLGSISMNMIACVRHTCVSMCAKSSHFKVWKYATKKAMEEAKARTEPTLDSESQDVGRA